MQIKRRGVELRLLMNGDRGKAQKADPALLKAIARAHRWFDDLVTGRVASMAEIGKREGLPKNYVSWLIRLAFLAPDIVEAIIQGNHPPDLTAQTLITRRIELPLQWEAQKPALPTFERFSRAAKRREVRHESANSLFLLHQRIDAKVTV
jgi:site-specific DNA recombinase